MSLLVLCCSAKNQEDSILEMKEGLSAFVCRKNVYFPHSILFAQFFSLLFHNTIVKCACFFVVRTARPTFKTQKLPSLQHVPG